MTLLGGSGNSLKWSYDDQSRILTISVADDELDEIQYAWAFKISYVNMN